MPETSTAAPAFRRKILLSILLPVLLIGVLISYLSIRYLTPPLLAFIQDRIESELKLGSLLGLRICENHFNYLMDLRLENDQELNVALKAEALEEIKAVSAQFHKIQMMIVGSGNRILGSTGSMPPLTEKLPLLERMPDGIQSYIFLGNPVKAHHRYFPFWGWTVVSYTLDKDYLAPILMARRVVYLGTFGVLAAVWAALLVVIRRTISQPLRQLVSAAEDVAEGRFSRVPLNRNDEIGRVVFAFNTMVDRLYQQKGELTALIDAVRESEGRYRELFEGAVEGILVANGATKRFIFANPAICRMLGYPETAFTQMSVMDIHPRDQWPLVAAEFEALAAGSGNARLPGTPCLRSDGSIIQADIKATQITIDGTLHLLGYFTDVTQKIKAANDKRALQARLHRAEKMEAIGMLAGGVAHDLNNILSGLVSYPELLLLDLPPESPLRKPVLTIEQSGKRAAAIVQDLLTLARRGVAVSEIVNLNDVVTAHLATPEFDKLKAFHPQVRFTIDLSPKLMDVMGSPVHLSKTIMNLLSNAAEASSPSGGHITLTTRNQYVDRPIRGYDEVEDGDYVVLTVTDDGIGISQEDLPRIFEPFYSKKVMGRSGTGLGMAVVWGTVKDHNGYINVSSQMGRGSTFELYFPVTRKLREDKPLAGTIEDLMGNGEHILVVDDIADQRDIAALLLDRLGYRVDTVASGEAAVEFISETPVDLVILDMIMDPGMDGLDTYREILKHAPGQKAVITSGFSESDRVQEAQKLGARQYVRKPYTIQAIGKALKTTLTGADTR